MAVATSEGRGGCGERVVRLVRRDCDGGGRHWDVIDSSSWAVVSMAVDVTGEETTSLECTCRSELDATGRT